MFVCLCKGISDRAVRACLREGARTVREVGMACGAGTDCGACRGVIRDLIEEHEEDQHVHLPIAASPAMG